MPSIRIGYSSEFVLRNELVGIGSTATSSRLDVAGQIRSENTAGSGGVSTFREYQGFSQVEAEVSNNILIDSSSGPYSSLTGEIKITGETTVSSGSTVEVGKTKTLTVTDRFAVPLGDTNTRDNAPEAGTTRFNQDFGTLEFFDGNNWKTVNSYSRGGSSRGYYSGGTAAYPSSYQKSIDLVNIQSTGGTSYFGDLTEGNGWHGSFSSSTRGVTGGFNAPYTNDMEYFTLSSGGNAIDFGHLDTQRFGCGGCSSSTRGILQGGYVPSPGANSNIIDYVEIATTGDALDFGDLTAARRYSSTFSSPVRGVDKGGADNADTYVIIDYATIASKGNSVDFGDCAGAASQHAGCSNSTRGIGSYSSGQGGDTRFDAVTIASTGNAINFGDLQRNQYVLPGFSCDHTRAVYAGGFAPVPSTASVDNMDYISLSSGGDAIDFGTLSVKRALLSACSDSHGGLGGF
tara:strand:+ start:1499 stop:2875 length:1377 start_codon:yes stop_codon:yes gene_type:complete